MESAIIIDAQRTGVRRISFRFIAAPRGIFVPEFDSAITGAPIGVPIGPVKTQFGYHLIWIVDRQSRALDLRELRFPISPSDSVRNAVARDAAMYAAELHSGQLPELVIELIKFRKVLVKFVVEVPIRIVIKLIAHKNFLVCG